MTHQNISDCFSHLVSVSKFSSHHRSFNMRLYVLYKVRVRVSLSGVTLCWLTRPKHHGQILTVKLRFCCFVLHIGVLSCLLFPLYLSNNLFHNIFWYVFALLDFSHCTSLSISDAISQFHLPHTSYGWQVSRV